MSEVVNKWTVPSHTLVEFLLFVLTDLAAWRDSPPEGICFYYVVDVCEAENVQVRKAKSWYGGCDE